MPNEVVVSARIMGKQQSIAKTPSPGPDRPGRPVPILLKVLGVPTSL